MQGSYAIPLAFAIAFMALVFSFFLLNPQRAASQTSRVIFLTSGSSWTVPADWSNSSNSIEVIGGGGGGRTAVTGGTAAGGGGGGGGAYSRVSNVTLTPGASVSYAVGTGGAANTAGGDTYFCTSASNCASIAGAAVIVGAKGGSGGAAAPTGGVGGASASGIGTVKYSGGTGGNGGATLGSGGGGGGGAAGPSGIGKNGGIGAAVPSGNDAAASGGGGGGSNGGSSTDGGNGVVQTGYFYAAGGTGGHGTSGAGGGGSAAAGTLGGGGGGGHAEITASGGSCTPGAAGGTSIVWTQTSNGVTAGTGGGGGGGGGGGNWIIQTDIGKPGGSGALYGGGGGGGSHDAVTSAAGAPGAAGIIVITYSLQSAPSAPTISASTPGGGINLSWTAPADGGSALTGYKIYRDTASPAVSLLNTIAPSTSYLDSAALANTTYYYRVKATNAVGDSAHSNEVSATRPCTTTTPSSGNVSGWAWSDTIGWISLSSADSGACTSQAYGLDIDQDGTISGKMWSENIGWISADAADLTGCPATPCTARMNGTDMEGWMKALAANQSEAAWDGWISLSGANYGPTIESGVIEGYAWGDTNLGWISFDTAFSQATTTWTDCTPNYQCTSETTYDNLCTTSVVENTACTGGNICGGGAIACIIPPAPTGDGVAGNFRANPSLVAPGRTTNLTWDIRYATECSVTEDNPNITDSWSTTEGNVTTSPIRIQTVYTLTCTGAGGNLTQRATVYQVPNWKEL